MQALVSQSYTGNRLTQNLALRSFMKVVLPHSSQNYFHKSHQLGSSQKMQFRILCRILWPHSRALPR
jgi:hypothetical protein